jgi:hypothetical protein
MTEQACQTYQAAQAYIHILEAELTALRQRVRDAAAWYDGISKLIPSEPYLVWFVSMKETPEVTERLRVMCEECYAYGYGEHLSDSQYEGLIERSTKMVANRFIIYHVTMSRARAGLPITEMQVKIIHRAMIKASLVFSMCTKMEYGDEVNMHKLCKEIGHPKEINQRGCTHDPDMERMCNECFAWLRETFSEVDTRKFSVGCAAVYVPDAYIEDLRPYVVSSTLLDSWARKNAQFRKYNMRVQIFENYSLNPVGSL